MIIKSFDPWEIAGFCFMGFILLFYLPAIFASCITGIIWIVLYFSGYVMSLKSFIGSTIMIICGIDGLLLYYRNK